MTVDAGTMGRTGPRVAVVGSVNMDLVVRVERHPHPGETLLGSDYATHPGGKGANQAVAAARLGARVAFVGRVGEDAFGDRLAASLAESGVDTAGLARSERPSGVAFIQVDAAGQNSIVVSPGANHDLTPADLAAPAARAALTGAAVLLLQLEVPLDVSLAAAAAAREGGATAMLNLAPARRLADAELADVGVLLVNEYEAAIQLGAAAAGGSPSEWAVALCRSVPRAVVTLGADGAVWAERVDPTDPRGDARHGHVPAFSVVPVDTTAAGDAFAGALAYHLGLAEGRGSVPSLAEAVRFASAAGALATTRAGAQPSLPRLAEVERLLAGGEGA